MWRRWRGTQDRFSTTSPVGGTGGGGMVGDGMRLRYLDGGGTTAESRCGHDEFCGAAIAGSVQAGAPLAKVAGAPKVESQVKL